MEQTAETKQQRGNLLDKFIRNEKKAKLWAALSLLAFCASASTVLIVANQIKNGKDIPQPVTTEPVARPDSIQTIFITEDTAAIRIINEQAATIATLTDSIKDLQVRYEEKVQEVNTYIDLWKECQSGLIKDPPPVSQPLSVMIYTVKVPNDAIERIKAIVQQSGASKTGFVFNTATVPATNTTLMIKQNPVIVAKQDPATVGKKSQPPVNRDDTRKVSAPPPQRYYAGIKYFDVKYANEAATLAYELNQNSNIFANWQQLAVTKADASASKADIEIWLVAVSVNTLTK